MPRNNGLIQNLYTRQKKLWNIERSASQGDHAICCRPSREVARTAEKRPSWRVDLKRPGQTEGLLGDYILIGGRCREIERPTTGRQEHQSERVRWFKDS